MYVARVFAREIFNECAFKFLQRLFVWNLFTCTARGWSLLHKTSNPREKKNSYSDETENSYSHQRTRPAWAKAWEKELIWNPTQCHKPVDICHLGNVPRIALWITRKLFADLCIASVHCVSPRLLIYAFLFRAARRRLCTYTVAVSQAVSSRRHFPNLSVHLWSQI